MIDRDRHLDIEPPPPALQLRPEEDLRGARAVEYRDPPVAGCASRALGRSPGAAAQGQARRQRIPRRCPRAAVVGHAVPYGPRSPTTAPVPSFAIAPLTAPTSRTVWTNAPGRAGSPLMLIATSPMPKAYSMLNWPGRKEGVSPASGTSSSVEMSASSRRARCDPIRQRHERIELGCLAHVAPSRTRRGSACRRLPAVRPPRKKALHHLVAEMIIGLALVAQALGIDADRADQFHGAGIEPPAIRRHQP